MPRPKKPQNERKKLSTMWLARPLATTLQNLSKQEHRTLTNLIEYILTKYLIDNNIPIISPQDPPQIPQPTEQEPCAKIPDENTFPIQSITSTTDQPVEQEPCAKKTIIETPFD